MLDFYFSATPNGLKVKLFLEEAGLAYRGCPVALSKGEQFAPEFTKISPNNKIPAIVDRTPVDGGEAVAIFESGAILLYLAQKTGLFLPREARARMDVLQWLFWQVSGLGPMGGQAGHFTAHAPQEVPYAIARYTKEMGRLYGVLNLRLKDREFIAGAFSIADMACYPWIVPHTAHRQNLEDFPHLARWFAHIAARPATRRIYRGVEDVYAITAKPMSAVERAILFGQSRRQRACRP